MGDDRGGAFALLAVVFGPGIRHGLRFTGLFKLALDNGAVGLFTGQIGGEAFGALLQGDHIGPGGKGDSGQRGVDVAPEADHYALISCRRSCSIFRISAIISVDERSAAHHEVL